MLYIGLQNYSHFQELFSKRETNNGKTICQNGILLSYYKNAIKNHGLFPEAKDVTTMTSLFNEVMYRVMQESHKKFGFSNVNLMGKYNFHSNQFYTDNLNGICMDEDYTSIRYIKSDSGREYKMKAGKFLRKIIMETEYGKKLDESTLLYVLETFTQKWQSYAMKKCGDFNLVVDEDFESIYNSRHYVDGADFHSCMTDNDQHYFYESAVKAKAASIWKNNKMFARCIIFTDVMNESTGEILRLAERQYSADQKELYKHILINKLIQAGEIDGYKKIGAGCHDSRMFVANDGTDLSDCDFSIKCYLNPGDTLSYQDSFKYYDMDNNKSYNSDKFSYSCDLATTDGRFEGGEWDSYHEEYVREVCIVYYWSSYRGCWDKETCDVNRMDDFILFDGEYYHFEHCVWSECEQMNIPNDKAVYLGYDDDYCREDSLYYFCEDVDSDVYEDNATYCDVEEIYCHDDNAYWCEKADSYFSSEDAMNDWLEENAE